MPHAPGWCVSCRVAPSAPDRTRCEPCAARRREHEAAQREERRAAGRCLTCGKRALKDRRYCRAHLTYYAERDATRRAGS